MIRKIISFLSLLFCGMASNAQDSEKFWQQFQQLYNEDKFAEIYDMLDVSFQKEMSLEEHTDFFKEQVKAAVGKMNTAQFIKNKNGGQVFVLSFEKMKLEVLLYLNSEQKVQGWLWQPYKEQTTPKFTKNVQSSNPLKTSIDSFVDEQAKDYLNSNPKAQLSFALIQNNQVNYYFYADENALPDHSSKYEIGSITKTYIGWLVAQAVEEGKLKIEDDIAQFFPKHYPNLAYQEQAIKIKHLLNHSSGLPSLPDNITLQENFNDADFYVNYNDAMLLAYLEQVKLDKTPGSQSVYSNLGFAILGYILEQTYKQPLETIINQQLRHQLNLAPISFSSSGLLSGFDEMGKPTPAWHFKTFAGAGAIKTNIKNLVQFLEANINKKTKAINRSLKIIDATLEPATGYAWGIQKLQSGTDHLIWHNGGTGGFRTFYGFSENKKIGIVVLSNVNDSVDELAYKILQKMYQ